MGFARLDFLVILRMSSGFSITNPLKAEAGGVQKPESTLGAVKTFVKKEPLHLLSLGLPGCHNVLPPPCTGEHNPLSCTLAPDLVDIGRYLRPLVLNICCIVQQPYCPEHHPRPHAPTTARNLHLALSDIPTPDGNSPLHQPPINHVPLQHAFKEQCEAKH